MPPCCKDETIRMCVAADRGPVARVGSASEPLRLVGLLPPYEEVHQPTPGPVPRRMAARRPGVALGAASTQVGGAQS